ncbi:MAG: hypothetical protein QXD04_05285, partial [Candidatus Bathyarchaeia archaeon]
YYSYYEGSKLRREAHTDARIKDCWLAFKPVSSLDGTLRGLLYGYSPELVGSYFRFKSLKRLN